MATASTPPLLVVLRAAASQTRFLPAWKETVNQAFDVSEGCRLGLLDLSTIRRKSESLCPLAHYMENKHTSIFRSSVHFASSGESGLMRLIFGDCAAAIVRNDLEATRNLALHKKLIYVWNGAVVSRFRHSINSDVGDIYPKEEGTASKRVQHVIELSM